MVGDARARNQHHSYVKARSVIEESKVMTKLDLGGTAIWHDQVA